MSSVSKDSLTRSVRSSAWATPYVPLAVAPRAPAVLALRLRATKSSAPKPSTSTSAAAIPCALVKRLRTSLTNLTKTGINPTSASKLTTDLKDIQSELVAIKGHVSGNLANQVSQLNVTITKISTDAKGLTSNPAGAITKLTADLSKLRSTAGPVITEKNAACPK